MIRFNKDYNKLISRTVKNYNARVSRAKAKNLATPEKIKVSELKSQYYTRQGLNRKLKELELFTAKNASTINKWGGTLYEEKLANYRYRPARQEIKARIRHAKGMESRAVNYVDSNRYSYEKTEESLVELHNKVKQGKKLTRRQYRDYINLTADLTNTEAKAMRLRDSLLKMMASYMSWQGVPYKTYQQALDEIANLSLSRLDALSKYSNLFKNWLDIYHIDSYNQSVDLHENIYKSGKDAVLAFLRSLTDDVSDYSFA